MPARRSTSAVGSGDWWKEVKMTASLKRRAASRAVSPVSVSGRTGGGSRSTHGARQAITSSTPGSSRAAAAPRGPASMVTRPQAAAMARTAGPASRTSPALSRRTARQCRPDREGETADTGLITRPVRPDGGEGDLAGDHAYGLSQVTRNPDPGPLGWAGLRGRYQHAA